MNLVGINPAADVLSLIKTIIENEDEFYVKIFANGQEVTSASNTLITDSKLISELGLKDMQSINIGLNRYIIASTSAHAKSRAASSNNNIKLDPNCVPMLILSKETHFTNLFRLLNKISSLDMNSVDSKFRKIISISAAKVWEVIMLLPTNRIYYDLIEADPEQYLLKVTDQLSLKHNHNATHQTNEQISLIVSLHFPHQLLYFLQIVEIIYKHHLEKNENSMHNNTYIHIWAKYFFKMLIFITRHLMANSNLLGDFANENTMNGHGFISEKSNNNNSILLESALIVLRLFCSSIFSNMTSTAKENVNTLIPNATTKSSLSSDKPQNIYVDNLDELNNGETPRKKPKRIHVQHQLQNQSSSKTHFININFLSS